MINILYTDSAFKHGISKADIEHALQHTLNVQTITEDPLLKELIFGIDTSGRILELITLTKDNTLLVIHAMKIRKQYLKHL